MSSAIKQLPIEERPYEKLERGGPSSLSDAELVAVVLRTGSRKTSALDLARQLILDYSGTSGVSGLSFLLDASLEELMSKEGIGRVKGLQLLAAAEVGRRACQIRTEERPILNTPRRAADYIAPTLMGKPREQLVLLMLDTKQRLIRPSRVSEGSLSSIMIQPRDLLREAVRSNAAGIILVHNHPSGDPTPSSQDIAATESLIEAARLIGVPLQDHIVIGHEGYASIREQTRLWENGC